MFKNRSAQPSLNKRRADSVDTDDFAAEIGTTAACQADQGVFAGGVKGIWGEGVEACGRDGDYNLATHSTWCIRLGVKVTEEVDSLEDCVEVDVQGSRVRSDWEIVKVKPLLFVEEAAVIADAGVRGEEVNSSLAPGEDVAEEGSLRMVVCDVDGAEEGVGAQEGRLLLACVCVDVCHADLPSLTYQMLGKGESHA